MKGIILAGGSATPVSYTHLQESKVSSSQIVSLRCQFTPEYTRSAGNTTRALTAGVEFVHVKDVAARCV